MYTGLRPSAWPRGCCFSFSWLRCNVPLRWWVKIVMSGHELGAFKLWNGSLIFAIKNQGNSIYIYISHQGLLAASRVSTSILYRCGSKPSKLTSFCWDEHPFPSDFRVPYLPTWPCGRSLAAPCRNPSRWDPTNGSCCGKNARSAAWIDPWIHGGSLVG